jgi:hypothetical protein
VNKFKLATAIIASCVGFVTGCGNFETDTSSELNKLIPLMNNSVDCVADPNNTRCTPSGDGFSGPSSVIATDGDYTDKVGVDWSPVEGAVTYKVFRSDKAEGSYNFIGTVNASDLIGSTSVAPSVDSIQIRRSTLTAVTPPRISFTTPINGASSVPVSTLLTADFNENVKCSTLTSSSFFLKQGSSSVAGTVSCAGSTATFTPAANLAKNTSYAATITTAVTDPEGTPMSANYSWSFTTESPSPTPPSVTSTTPSSGAANVASTTPVIVNFNESINCATITSSSFTLKQGGTTVAGTLACSGSTATFTPGVNLADNTWCTATVTTAVQDLEGYNMASDYIWSFKTTSPAPSGSHYFIDTNITPGRHYYYAVAAVDARGNVSLLSPADDGFARVSDKVPGKVLNCSASDGTYINKVTVTWTAASNATYYNVYRTNGTTVFLVGDNITETSYVDTNVLPGLFSYKVAPYNAFGEGMSSDSDTGFRALTNQEFFDEAYKNENAALNRIQLLKNTGMDMLGSETIYDKDGDGTCAYKATMDLSTMTGHSTITFTNFCDLYLTLNGTQVLNVDMSMNGTVTGQLNLSGIYNGYIRFDVLVTGGSSAGGYYYVSQNGGAETSIPGTYIQPFQ